MTFGRLTRKDLTVFDRIAQDLILDAIDKGCTGRISTKGHCILRNNNGDSASVPRNMASSNRSSLNARAQVRRLLDAHHQDGTDSPPAKAAIGGPEQFTVAQALINYGAAFSFWLDEHVTGLPPDAVIEVRHDETARAAFEHIPAPTETEDTIPMSSADAKRPGTDDSTTLRQIRDALGEDPKIAELRAEIATLKADLNREKSRADEAEARIALGMEALGS